MSDQVRHISDGPFGWFNKPALRHIRRNSEEHLSGQMVFVAMCDIASDHQAETFTVAQVYIAKRAGASLSTVKRRLSELERLGLIKVARSGGVNLISTYTLLSFVEDHRTNGNDDV